MRFSQAWQVKLPKIAQMVASKPSQYFKKEMLSYERYYKGKEPDGSAIDDLVEASGLRAPKPIGSKGNKRSRRKLRDEVSLA